MNESLESTERALSDLQAGVRRKFRPPATATSSHLASVAVTTEPNVVAGQPVELFDMSGYRVGTTGRSYDVAPDGKRFLLVKTRAAQPDDPRRSEINVVLDWDEELRRLVPTQ